MKGRMFEEPVDENSGRDLVFRSSKSRPRQTIAIQEPLQYIRSILHSYMDPSIALSYGDLDI